MKAALLFLAVIGLDVVIAAHADDIKLDHVIIAVRDLGEASQSFHESGFVVKDGRLHANGLLNSFIEMPDGTEIELMSVRGKPGDAMAEAYAGFLAQSEGGIYAALSGIELTAASRRLRRAGIDHEIKPGRLWDFLVFPSGSGLEHVFLIQMHRPDSARQAPVNHKNGVSGIRQLWLDSSNELKELLRVLKVARCPGGQAYRLSNASLHLLGRENNKARPRFKGIVFSIRGDNPLNLKHSRGIWYKSSGKKACDENA